MPWSDKWLKAKTDWDKNVEDFSCPDFGIGGTVGWLVISNLQNLPIFQLNCCEERACVGIISLLDKSIYANSQFLTIISTMGEFLATFIRVIHTR